MYPSKKDYPGIIIEFKKAKTKEDLGPAADDSLK